MAKFATFKTGDSKPLEEYEGDSMEMEGEHVRIYKAGSFDHGTYDPTHPSGSLVASIRLAEGHEVRKISE